MPNSSRTKRFDWYLLVSAVHFSFCLCSAFWLATFADVFDYILAAVWTFVGCINLLLSIRDYVDEKIKTALHDKTAEAPAITTERR